MNLIKKFKSLGLWQMFVIGLATTTIILFFVALGIYSVSVYKLISDTDDSLTESKIIELVQKDTVNYKNIDCNGRTFSIPKELELMVKKDVTGCFYTNKDKALYIDKYDFFQISGTKLSEVMNSNRFVSFEDEKLKQLKLNIDHESNLFKKILITQDFLKSQSFIWFLMNPGGALLKNTMLTKPIKYRYQKFNNDYLIERTTLNSTTYIIYTDKNESFQFLFDSKTINNLSTFFTNNF